VRDQVRDLIRKQINRLNDRQSEWETFGHLKEKPQWREQGAQLYD